VLDSLAPEVRKSCLRTVYKICGHQALLPRALTIQLDSDLTGDALYGGGFADVWKGRYRDQDVAVKILRVYQTNVQQIKGVGRWSCFGPAVVDDLRSVCKMGMVAKNRSS